MRRESWVTQALIGSEVGRTWTNAAFWTSYISGGGSFYLPTFFGVSHPIFGWENNAGASLGVRAFLQANISNATTMAHSVHMRIQGSLGNAGSSGIWGLSPATCVHAGSDPLGNCYFLQVFQSVPVEHIDLYRHKDGVTTLLAAFVKQATTGDYVTLSYEYVAGVAELEVFVNGESAGAFSDSSGDRFDMAGVGGKPGFWGSDSPVSAAGVGFWTTEWWVTNGFQSVGEFGGVYPYMTGAVSVVLKKVQRYTNDPDETRIIVQNEILSCRWGFTRIGGCNQASLDFRFGQAGLETVAPPAREDLFVHPSAEHWEETDWLGGMMEIHVRFDARDVAAATSEKVWSGSISGVQFDRATRRISITGDGLYKLLETAVIVRRFERQSVRECLIGVLEDCTKTRSDAIVPHDFPVRYNPAKILGIGSIMDFILLEQDFRWESAKSAIETLLAFLPEGLVWGVDQDGEFYLSISGSPYSDDLSLSVPVVWYDAAAASEFTREFRFDEVVNFFQALGTEPDDKTEPRVSSVSACDRSRALYGLRWQTEDVSDTTDPGILGKFAQTLCKQACTPAFSATLRVRESLRGSANFWKSLSVITPPVAVIDRWSDVNQAPAGEALQTDHALRLIGDISGSMPSLRGSGVSIAQVRFASIPLDRALNTHWLIHITLKFTHPHPGGIGDAAFIFGRPTGVAFDGWGGLYWDGATGQLNWFQNELGAPVQYSTGITVSTAGSVTPVHLTIARRSNGAMQFYNGAGAATASTGANANSMLTSATEDWRFWFHPAHAGTLMNWDGAIEQFWLIDTVALGWGGDPIDGQPGGLAAFLARNNQSNLGYQEGCGCLMHIKFNERIAAAIAAGGFNITRNFADHTHSATIATLVNPGTSYADVASASNDTARGHVFGNDHRWGGPLILTADSVEYDVDPSTGSVEITYELASRPIGLGRSIEALQEEVRRQTEALRRIHPDI